MSEVRYSFRSLETPREHSSRRDEYFEMRRFRFVLDVSVSFSLRPLCSVTIEFYSISNFQLSKNHNSLIGESKSAAFKPIFTDRIV